MAASIKATSQGLITADKARRLQGWTKTAPALVETAHVSVSTIKRFWMGKPIGKDAFVAICEALGVDWQDITDNGSWHLRQLLNEGVEVWNEWKHSNPPLSYNFDGVDLSNTDLRGFDFSNTSLVGTNLNGSNLENADLSRADLTNANFSGANLKGANLTAAQALSTVFTGAILTGACLQDWNINRSTRFENTICDYIYLQYSSSSSPQKFRERRPKSGNFASGQFAVLYQKAVETFDFIFTDNIDWTALLQSFQQLRAQYGDDNTSIQIIENKNFSGGKEANFKNIVRQESTELLPLQKESSNTLNIDELVQTARDKIAAYIEERCGTMRVLDMTQPIGLDDIYTSVNILEKITGRIRVASIEELIENVPREEFKRLSLGEVHEKRVPGLEAVAKYSKLMILGKPGAGKTTFLKHLALLCIRGKFQENRIPLFITLKDFAEAPSQPKLLSYLNQIFIKYTITTNTDAGVNFIEQLLKQGKLLLLLDGLDEVRETDSARVLKQIQDFTTDYPALQFVITCRIASREYTFEQFTEVEIADFNLKQIEYFSKKWFTAKNDMVKADKFVLNLQDDKPIRELATNPLLLTLLCLVFEESAEFPKNRSELYKEGLDVLLKKWDGKRNIEREQIYKKLSLKRKEDLLSQVAYSTFEQGQYFFKQKEVEARIVEYIRNLPDCSDDLEVLQLDSEAVLKSIEAQHGLFVERARGIYSFSHLTFHEYFTARKIKETGDDKLLRHLAAHITETRWREVFFLTVGMLDSADLLLQLMKQQVDSLLADDERLQQYLVWVEEKSNSVQMSNKPAALRAYYFSLDLDLTQNLALNLDRHLDQNLDLDRSLTLTDDARGFALDCARDPDFLLSLNLDQELHGKLHYELQQLKAPLSNLGEDVEAFKEWWVLNGANWAEQLRAIMIEHRNIGHDWQFTDSQIELLDKYHGANELLVECLNSDCYVSRDVRKYIEDTLLLPIKSIPKACLE